MSTVLNAPACRARKLARQQAKAEYDAHPVKCEVCANPVPYGRFIKGARACRDICSHDLIQKSLREYRERNRQNP